MKTFVLAVHPWCEEDIEMSIVQADSKEDVLKQYIRNWYEEESESIDESAWANKSINDYLCDMGVTCAVIEVK